MNIKFYTLQESNDNLLWFDLYNGELYYCKQMFTILSKKNRHLRYRIVRLCR